MSNQRFNAHDLRHSTVCPWDTGAAVIELQNLLRAHGFILRADGDYGWITEVAVKEFQAQHNLRVDSVVKAEMWAILKSTVKPGTRMIQKGDSGMDVYELQGLLVISGYTLPRTGIFCEQTQAAVLEFQQRCRLVADGIVDAISWTVLYNGKKLPNSPKQLSWFFRPSKF